MAVQNIFAQGMDALDTSYARERQFGQDVATRRAGRRLQGGDYKGASGELLGEGMLSEGAAVSKLGQQQEDRGAAEQAAQAKAKAEGLIQLSQGLKGVPAGQRAAKLRELGPLFQHLQIDPTPFMSLNEEQLSDQNLDLFSGQVAKEAEQFTLSPGSARYDARGNVIAEQPFAPNYQKVGPGERLLEFGGRGGQASSGAPQAGGGFDAAVAGVLQREGGYNGSDGHSAAPVNFGINQKANPDIDVRNLTQEGAKQIYKQRYWDAIGADQLPPEAQAAVFDAAVNQGVGAAQQMWQAAGGDLQRFNQLRIERYRQTPGYEQYGKVWESRVAETGGGQQQGQTGGARIVAQGAPKPVERWEDLPGGGQRNSVTGETKNVPQPKGSGRLSAAALNLQNTALDAIQSSTKINSLLERHEARIRAGKLNLNPVNNFFSTGVNMVGASTEASQNFASFRADLERLRNESLRLNKGVQTEGDSQRAWNELIANINDEGVVKQRLEEIKGLNEQAAAYHADVVTQLREDSGLPPLDTSRFRSKPAAPAGGGRTQRPAASAPGAPKPGTVVKGYRFKGGNPADRASWVKV